MLRVIPLQFSLVRATTSAFYLGETRQQITEAASIQISKNYFLNFILFRISAKVAPSVTSEILLDLWSFNRSTSL
jgi:hypothetical protein